MVPSLTLGVVDQLDDIVWQLNSKHSTALKTHRLDLNSFLLATYDPESEKLFEKLYRYVPYRLLSPYYSDQLKRKKDGEKNSIIENATHDDDDVIYKIFSDKRIIIVNEIWYQFIHSNWMELFDWLQKEIEGHLKRNALN